MNNCIKTVLLNNYFDGNVSVGGTLIANLISIYFLLQTLFDFIIFHFCRHYPVGVLFDLHTKAVPLLPWNLTVHFQV